MSGEGFALYILCDPNDEMTTWTYRTPILPIVDFNADGNVDIEDLKAFIAEWEKANPLAPNTGE